MDEAQVRRTVTRIAHEIIERDKGVEDVVLVGIRRRGEPIARMLAEAIARVEGTQVPVGTVDITFYRDDLTHISLDPKLNRTDIPFAIGDRTVVLVDDVLYTGRTARAALDALTRPIRADFAGKNVPTAVTEFVRVAMPDIDGETGVWLCDR